MWIQAAVGLYASGTATTYPVKYTPLNSPAGIFDAVPAGTATSYTFDVTSPANFPVTIPATSFSPTGSNISIVVTTGPAGAASYLTVTLDPATAQSAAFTGPNQTLRFRVTGIFPVVTISTTYAFTITIVNWPVGADSLENFGHFVSASSVPPPPAFSNPPTIQISAPFNNPTYTPASLPTTVPLNFTVVGDNSNPISSVGATLSGPGISGAPLALTVNGLTTATVTGSAAMPVSNAGTFTVNVTAAGSSTVSAQSSFTVALRGTPPTVTIPNPVLHSTYTAPGGQTVHVPFDFAASCVDGTLKAVQVRLDGVITSYAFTSGGLNTTSATGSTPLDIGVAGAGPHTIVVTAANQFGAASATTDFVVYASQTILFNPLPAHTYGDPAFALTATSTAGLPVSYSSSDPAIASTSGSTVTILRAGTVTITAQQAGAQYVNAAANVLQTLTINPAVLTVTADSKAKIYGGPVPTLTAGITGFVNGESQTTPGVVTGSPAIATLATAASPVGLYAIVPSAGTLVAANYTFVFANGALNVTPASLTVSAQPVTKLYGATLPTLTAAITGFVNGDTAGVVSGAPALTTAATASSSVGSYPITIGLGTLAAASYSFRLVGSTVTVTPAILTFAALNASRAYGAANPAFGYAVSGYVNNDGAATAYTGAPILTTTATPTSTVAGSPYPITIAAGTLASANYAFLFAAGSLSVTPAILTVTADNKSMTQGTAIPALTATIRGFVNGETASVVSGSASLSTTATTTSPVGTYPITAAQGTLNAANYTFAFAPGVLTVSAASTCGTVIVRHAPDLNGNAGVDGSLQMLLPENVTLNGNDWISKDLLVPGLPATRINGHPTIGAIADGTGSAAPGGYTITFDGIPVLGRLVRRTDPVSMPVISAPPAATGTRDVRLNKSGDSVGDFGTVRDLTVSGNFGQLTVPAGNYRDLTANGSSGFTLGVAGATQPSVYYVRNLKMSGTGCLKILGPVTLTIVDDIDFDGTVGNSSHTDWLTLKLYSGDLTMNGSMSLYANVLAPVGTVCLNGLAKLCGGLTCDRLRLDGNALVDVCGCDTPGSDDDHHDGNGSDDQSHGNSNGGSGDDHGGGHS